MALLIKSDGTKIEIKGEEEDGSLSYAQIKKSIGGGFFQFVGCDPTVTGGFDHYFCDEEGKFKGFRKNEIATALSTYTSVFDMVVGDVLFCKLGGKDKDRSF